VVNFTQTLQGKVNKLSEEHQNKSLTYHIKINNMNIRSSKKWFLYALMHDHIDISNAYNLKKSTGMKLILVLFESYREDFLDFSNLFAYLPI